MAQKDLVPMNKRTKEEQKRIATMGGKASGKARKEKATMKKMLEACLEMKNKNGKTYQELVTLGLIKGAMNGNSNNYRTILETLGQLREAEENKKQQQMNKVEELLEQIKNEAIK